MTGYNDFLSGVEAVAIKAAKEAGVLILKKMSTTQSNFKEGNTRNVVTSADNEADAIIRKIIQAQFPDTAIITEEDKPKEGNEFCWHIDPIDGTVNYSRGETYFCVAIGLAKMDELMVGVIYRPTTGELYTAAKGKGAFLNSKPIRTASTNKLEQAILCTDFGYEDSRRRTTMEELKILITVLKGIRMPGSGALEMCEISKGVAQCHTNQKSTSWDYAAATLIVREAGGVVTDYDGKHWTPMSKSIVASCTQEIHSELLEKIRKAAR